MESERLSWRLVPEDDAARLAAEAPIAGYRPEPKVVVMRVGERRNLLDVRAIPIGHHGEALQWTSHRIDGTENPEIAYYDTTGLLAVAPGVTRLALTPGRRTAAGDLVTVYVTIRVVPA
ncbi:MAG: hypothetical protein ACJ79K_12380 [Gemmatimonadaceae bacterium]